MFVVLEGIDGSGKSTQVDLVAERLRKNLVNGIEVQTVKFPVYDSPTGVLIGKMLKAGLKSHDSVLLFQSLMAINRFEYMSNLSCHNTLILADRYALSGLVYGLAQGLDFNWLQSVNSFLPIPDAIIFLDVTPQESFRRRPVRRDAMEADLQFVTKTYELYKEHLPLDALIVDGARPQDFVTSAIIDKIALVNPTLTYRF